MPQILAWRRSFRTSLTPDEVAEVLQEHTQQDVELFRTRQLPFSGSPAGFDFELSFQRPRRKLDPRRYDPHMSVNFVLTPTVTGTTVSVRVSPPTELYFFPLVLTIPALYYRSLDVFAFSGLMLAPYVFVIDSVAKSAISTVREILQDS